VRLGSPTKGHRWRACARRRISRDLLLMFLRHEGWILC
jgi:hypothetical protein